MFRFRRNFNFFRSFAVCGRSLVQVAAKKSVTKHQEFLYHHSKMPSCERRQRLMPFSGGCRWCDGAIRPPRRTFCSAACVHEYKIRSNTQYMRRCVYRRDRGICAICGVSTALIGKAILAAETQDEAARIRTLFSVPASRKVWRRKFGSAVFDVDHIRPVCQGGGLAGLDNLQTLCLSCHKCVTWSQCAGKARRTPS